MVRRLVVSLTLIVAGFVGGLVLTGRMKMADTTTASPAPPAAASAQRGVSPPANASAYAVNVGPDFTRVAGQAVKGVANISSVTVVRSRRPAFPDDEFFRYFFGDSGDMFAPRDRRSMSLGSGVIISADGYIVTNNHVIGDNVRATEVTASFSDKRELRGKIIGVDPTTDIALVKVNLTGLQPLMWGDSGQLKVGEWVLAIGSPFSSQLSQTVTAGIVSATGRSHLGFSDYEDFIQTDAAINPGNSGGALVNTRGEVVGINTGIFSQSGGYQGIGFAIPSNLARRVVDELKQYGEVRRGSIGYLGVEELTPELAREYGAPNTNGALIAQMRRDSAAFEAGIRAGDVVVAFNGQQVADPSQFLRMVADAKIGSTAVIRVLRDGRTMEFKLPIISTAGAARGRR
jgi:Do/DeqQ family serine protease